MSFEPVNLIKEAAVHKAIADYMSDALPHDAFWTTIPLGGGGKIRGAQLKRAGVKQGTPDMLVVYQGRAIFLEIKTPAKQSRVSDPQRLCHADIAAAGAPVAVVRSTVDVECFLRNQGLPLKATVSA